MVRLNKRRVSEAVFCRLTHLLPLRQRDGLTTFPENILLTSEGVVKLADFGLAIDLNQELAVTRAGTLDYMVGVGWVCHSQLE